MIRRHRRLSLALALAVGLVATSCGGGTSPPPTQQTTPPASSPGTVTPSPVTHTLAPSAEIVKVLADVPAGCAISQVSAGLPPVPSLPSCANPVADWTKLPKGSIVTTSACGLAWLDICGRLYVFQGSRLEIATCPPPATGSGCLTSGSVAWFETTCSNQVVIATPTGTIQLIGTWVSATYVAERQLTIFAVFDGTGVVVPVIDAASGNVGEPSRVETGSFWFTLPGDQPTDIAGLRAREPHPFSDLPALVHELHLETWFGAITEQANLDKVDVSRVPDMPVVDVRMAGGKMDGPDAQEAARLAFDWPAETKRWFGQPDLAVVGLAGNDPPVNLLAQVRDFRRASDLVATAGLDRLSIKLIVQETHELVGLADSYASTLKELGFSPEPLFAGSSDEAAAMFNRTIAEGSAAIWIAQH